ncbi:MAG: dephospho-CoA kinase [Aquificaceae bacterium]|nr:dephospho-CoA kinase [Aquificaceae bacterium]MCS7277861.1 dephospho-CoA kinase [Aquificaceae bacterium]MDW8422852.1 dephospho-CoA kinase [Aquificaceae bacterium]
MKDWKKHEKEIEELKKALEEALGGLDVEYEVKTPEDPDFETSYKVPYILLKYYTDEEHAHTRRIELFEYYFDMSAEERIKLIKDMVEEFLMEIDQSEYGGG